MENEEEILNWTKGNWRCLKNLERDVCDNCHSTIINLCLMYLYIYIII